MKKKTNKLLFILLIAILIFSVLAMFACQPPQDGDTDEDTTTPSVTDTAIVKNGYFANATTNDQTNAYLKNSVTNWSPVSGVTSYDKRVGVINLKEDVFNANKNDIYSGFQYPGIAPNTPKNDDGAYTDTNALIVSSLEAEGSLYYKSAAITIAKGKYYKLSMDVFSQILNADPNNNLQGAWIYINTGAYAEFQAINTDKQWKTYTLYIEANNSSDRTMYIQFWLGYGPKYIGSSADSNTNPRMTKGIAMFDNVVMSSISKTDFDAVYDPNGRRDTTVVSDTKTVDTAVVSLKYPDANFSYVGDYSTTSSSSYKSYFSAKVGVPNSNNYTGQVGKDKIEDTSDFPTSAYGYTYSTVGIFDMSKLFAATYDEQNSFKEYADTYKAINSAFIAPKVGANYQYASFMDAEHNYRLAGRTDNPADSTALTIFHPDYAISGYGYKGKNTLLIEKDTYYTISVWTYVWVPEYGKKAVDNPDAPTDERLTAADKPVKGEDEAQEAYMQRLDAYNANINLWTQYDKDKKAYVEYIADKAAYEKAASKAQSTFKLTGATIEGGETVRKSTEGQQGVWELLTFKIKGNELSSRSVSLEFWYGEGNWGEEKTLMAGGCFFDNITIQESATAANPGDFETLSPLTPEDYSQFGLLGIATEDYTAFTIGDESGNWQYSFEDKKTSLEAGDAGIIKGSAAKNALLWQDSDIADFFAGYPMPDTFNLAGELFDLVMLRNNSYTSSILSYKPKDGDAQPSYLTVTPNAFYRLSMWVRTDGIDDGLGLNVGLIKKDDVSMTSLSKINTKGEWTEVTFYLQGSSDDVAEFYIKYTLGSGDNYTPANLIKGAAYITAFTFKTIAYSEYTGATSGTNTTKYTVPSSASAKDTVTNGWFTNLDSSTFSGDKKDQFDAEGNLSGVAIPESWTAKGAESILDKPIDVKVEDGKLVWTKGSDNDQLYLIYMDGIKIKDDLTGKVTKTVDNYFIGQTAVTEWDIASGYAAKGGSFKVRAIRNTAGEDENLLGFSDFSLPKTYDGENKGSYNVNNVGKYIPKAGIIDYKHYEGSFAKDTAFYTANHDNVFNAATNPNGELYYVSPYDKLLMLSSDYNTRLGYLSPSTGSLTSDAYYAVSVWVKTVDGARASITISNKSNVISINNPEDGDYIGFVDQDTQGKWVQYTFYIKTTKMSSPAGLQLELYLGNKYAEAYKVGSKSYIQGLSKGTVFFDDIYYKKLTDEAEYNRLAYGSEDPSQMQEGDKYTENTPARLKDKISGNMFANNYIFKLIDLTTDSFDSFTEGTSPLGGTPGAYSHYNVKDAVAYSASDETPAMLYGVYDKRTVIDDVGEKLLAAGSKTAELFANEDALRAFLTQDVGTGNNFLMLANLKNNGQYYLTSDSFSLSGGAYYKISFWAKLKADEGKKAEFRFEYGNKTDDWSTVYVTSDQWKEYTFYIYNSGTDSVSGNKFSFYLGTNESTVEGEVIGDMFAGVLVIDNVTFAPLSDSQEYEATEEAYNALSNADKAKAGFGFYKFVKTETPPENGPDDPGKGEKPPINSQLWLLVSSIVIGALLIAVVVVLTWRKISKRVKRNIPVKVISNVPVNMQTKEQRKTSGSKKDIHTDDFTD